MSLHWYRTGSVTLKQGSKTVTGNTAYWQSAINHPQPGDIFSVDMQTLYEITEIKDDNTLILDREWAGSDSEKTAYAIIRNSSATTNTRIAQQVSDVLQALGDRVTVSAVPPTANDGVEGDVWCEVTQ